MIGITTSRNCKPFGWGRSRRVTSIAGRLKRMCMSRHFSLQQCYELCAARLAYKTISQSSTRPPMHWGVALQVRQGERGLTITAITRPKQGEQCGILRDRHQLAVARRPTYRGKVPGENSN